MNSLTAQILVDIINEEMDMPADTVWLRDQNRMIPNDNGLYIVVGMTSAWPTANSVYMVEENTDGVITQHQISQVQQRENIQIDILSRSNDAITRNWEVIAAIQSFYAQQQQEANNFKIFRIPNQFVNLSSAEGGSILNRYSITVACMVWYRKDKAMPAYDYYDDFTTRADDYETIGTDIPLIEFEINAGGIHD